MYELKLGDCLELLPGLADESIDLVLTDPPYHITSKSSITFVKSGAMSTQERWGHWEKDSFEEYEEMVSAVIDESYRLLKPGKVLIMWLRAEYGGYFARYAETGGFKIFASTIWNKPNPAPHIRKTNYRSSFEYCMVVCKGDKAIPFNFLSQRQMTNVFTYPVGQKTTEHPTEKPLPLIKWQIAVHTNPDDLVLDPFTGSGTTGVAALELGRHFKGFEIYPEYYDMAVKRLENCQRQPELKYEIPPAARLF